MANSKGIDILIFSKSCLFTTKVNESERQALIENDTASRLKEIEKRKGFRKIFEAMIRKKAVFIGHNCIIDLLFTISHFGDQLPNTLNEFKNMLKGYFNE